jgi:hypothetical protein
MEHRDGVPKQAMKQVVVHGFEYHLDFKASCCLMSNACSQFFAGRDDFIIEALPARSQGGTFLLQCEVLSWNEQLALPVLQANSAV